MAISERITILKDTGKSDGDQLKQTRYGLDKDMDIPVYAKPELKTWEQVRETIQGLEKELNNTSESEKEVPQKDFE